MFPTLTDDQFDVLTKRYATVDPLKHIDERIRGLVQTLGEQPGVVPIWSCSGHTHEEQLAKDPESESEPDPNDDGHVIFGINRTGAATIFKLTRFLHEMVDYDKIWRTLRPSLSCKSLLWAFSENFHDDVQKKVLYQCWELNFLGSFKPKNHPVQEEFCQQLKDYLSARP